MIRVGFHSVWPRPFSDSIGANWFYQGETLGYRTLYVWFERENLMITLQTNSQPAADADNLHDLLDTIYQIVRHGAN